MKDVTNFESNRLDLFSLTPAQKKLVMAVAKNRGYRPKYAVEYINGHLAQLDWTIRLRAIMGKNTRLYVSKF